MARTRLDLSSLTQKPLTSVVAILYFLVVSDNELCLRKNRTNHYRILDSLTGVK